MQSSTQPGSGRAERRGATSAGGPRDILRLALPALGVLVAEPLYLLFDTAVVGRLGALALAGLAIGGLILAQVSTQLTFLTYGTTARAARRHGAGDRAGAVSEGVQATWLAIGIGIVIVLVMQAVARPVASVLAGAPDIAAQACAWLRVALFGVPSVLIGLAGNGWLRGVQDTVRPLRYVVAGLCVSGLLCPVLVHGLLGAPRLTLVGSAVANVTGQAVTAVLFLAALAQERGTAGPAFFRLRSDVLRAQLVLGRDLVARSLAFQACFLSAGAVAARFGAAAVAGHQLVLQLWNFVALALDSLAIAAQALVGAALGAGAAQSARALGWRVTRWSVAFSLVLAGVFAAGFGALPRIFTSDSGVIDQAHLAWWFFVCLVPVAGVVFALDGVLLGAGDAAYLRTATLAAAVVGFLPLIWLSLAFHWGLTGIWTGLALFVVLRAIAVVVRARSDRWLVTGPHRLVTGPGDERVAE